MRNKIEQAKRINTATLPLRRKVKEALGHAAQFTKDLTLLALSIPFWARSQPGPEEHKPDSNASNEDVSSTQWGVQKSTPPLLPNAPRQNGHRKHPSPDSIPNEPLIPD